MKKYLLLLATFGIFLFTSCSDDDDNGGETTDPIVGTWILVDASTFDAESCSERSFVTFNRGNTGSATFYIPEVNCLPQNSPGNWENLGNSRYSIAVPVLGNLEGDVDFTGKDNFTFQTAAAGSFTFERQ